MRMISCSFLACAQTRRRLALHRKHQRATRVRGRCTWLRTRLSRDTNYTGRLDRARLPWLATHTSCAKRAIPCMYDTASETCRPRRYGTVQVLPLAPPTPFHVVRAALLNMYTYVSEARRVPPTKQKGQPKTTKYHKERAKRICNPTRLSCRRDG